LRVSGVEAVVSVKIAEVSKIADSTDRRESLCKLLLSLCLMGERILL
jgi:hypothetical protein